jgi:hypothetical protein
MGRSPFSKAANAALQCSCSAKQSLHSRGKRKQTDVMKSARFGLLLGFTTGVEFMNRLVEIRRQEHFCRERALHDSERKTFWLAEAEVWEQRALDEIAFHFRECNAENPGHSIAAQSLNAA